MEELDLSEISPLFAEWADLWVGQDYDLTEPFLVQGDAPASFSTSRVVATQPKWCWDTNGWYELLGIEWPYVTASVGTISKSYVARGGQSDARMTYVFKQLLNKETRRRYHLTPLGSLYLQDEAVQAMIKEEIRRRREEDRRNGLQTSEDQVADDLGVELEDADLEQSDEDVDLAEPGPRSYWVWEAHDLDQDQHKLLMQRWECALLDAASEAGLERSLSIGVHGKPELNVFHCEIDSNSTPICYLHEHASNLESLAQRAIHHLMTLTE